MSRQTRALPNPGKAAADSEAAPLPPGSIKALRSALRARDGLPPEPRYVGVKVVSEAVCAAVARVDEPFSVENLLAVLGGTEAQRSLRYVLATLIRARQIECIRHGRGTKAALYRRLPAFDESSRPRAGLTRVEAAYAALRAEIKTAPVTFGDVLEHPSQR